jgi:methionyl-tRNA synthetase
MSQYPEHDKLAKVSDYSQAQGEFLAWLQEQGVQLMTWHESDEPDDCGACSHRTEASKARCNCACCNGTHQVLRHREGFVSLDRAIPDLLAEYHGIDQRRLEAEKRAMLAALRDAA